MTSFKSSHFDEQEVEKATQHWEACECIDTCEPPSVKTTLSAVITLRSVEVISWGGTLARIRCPKGEDSAIVDREGNRLALLTAEATGLSTSVLSIMRYPKSSAPSSLPSCFCPATWSSSEEEEEAQAFEFARVRVRHNLFDSEGTYCLMDGGKEQLSLRGRRMKALLPCYFIYDGAGKVVAKVKKYDSTLFAEIAGGIDRLAVISLVFCLAPGGAKTFCGDLPPCMEIFNGIGSPLLH